MLPSGHLVQVVQLLKASGTLTADIIVVQSAPSTCYNNNVAAIVFIDSNFTKCGEHISKWFRKCNGIIIQVLTID